MKTKVTFGRETGGAFSWSHFFRFAASGVLGAIVASAILRLTVNGRIHDVDAAPDTALLYVYSVSIHQCLRGKICLRRRGICAQFLDIALCRFSCGVAQYESPLRPSMERVGDGASSNPLGGGRSENLI
jgi:hypothetical protein